VILEFYVIVQQAKNNNHLFGHAINLLKLILCKSEISTSKW